MEEQNLGPSNVVLAKSSDGPTLKMNIQLPGDILLTICVIKGSVYTMRWASPRQLAFGQMLAISEIKESRQIKATENGMVFIHNTIITSNETQKELALQAKLLIAKHTRPEDTSKAEWGETVRRSLNLLNDAESYFAQN